MQVLRGQLLSVEVNLVVERIQEKASFVIFYRGLTVRNHHFPVYPSEDAIIAFQESGVDAMLQILLYLKSLMLYPIDPVGIDEFSASEF
jgi:hypothetical protein